MTKEDTIEELILVGMKGNFAGGMTVEYTAKEIASAIKQHYLGKLPKEETAFKLENDYKNANDYVRAKERAFGYNQALADVRKVIGGEEPKKGLDK